MAFDTLILEHDGAVATVTINRPERLNAFRMKTIIEMGEALERAADDESVGVVVLTGAGDRAFCVGGDVADPTRTRKLLLHQKELARIFSGVQQKGHTCVCTKLYWKDHLIKAEIALAKGKAQHDKRHAEKERDWNREKQRLMRHKVSSTG